ncbi:MAG: SIR2 family NAD-dependent protein deacylase, partial [Thermomicrobiales bacterium]
FKMHGSISNVSTLVVTENDYAESLTRLSQNALGARIRDLLASKVVVFIGYSMTDWNFDRLYSALRADLGKFAPTAFVVSPHAGSAAERNGLSHLQTSGVKFVRELKTALQHDCLVADERYDKIELIESRAFRADEIAKEIPHEEYPSVLYCWMYLEGATDACFRIQNRRGSGQYSDAHHVQWEARRYLQAIDRAMSRGRFHDAAYMEGYANVLLALIIDAEDDVATFPYFFMYGSDDDLTNPEEFRTALEQSRRRAPKQRAYARRLLDGLPADMILTHDRTLPDLHTA